VCFLWNCLLFGCKQLRLNSTFANYKSRAPQSNILVVSTPSSYRYVETSRNPPKRHCFLSNWCERTSDSVFCMAECHGG